MHSVCLRLLTVFLAVVSSNIAPVGLPLSRSAVLLIGDRVELTCSATGDELIVWSFTAWNTSKATSIYFGEDIVTLMRSRYNISNKITGQHNLVVSSVDLAHAGRYRCISANGTQKAVFNDVQLTVLGSTPFCVANAAEGRFSGTEQTHLAICCNISYTGNELPVFNWTKSNALHITPATTTTSGSSGRLFTQTSSIRVQLYANDSGVTFQCRITFQTPGNSKGDFVFAWNYSIHYPAEESVGTHGATQGYDSTSLLYPVKPSDAGEDQGVLIIVLGIGGSLLLFLILALIVSHVVCKQRQKDNSSARPDVALNTDITSCESNDGILADNAVYAQVCKPKGQDGPINAKNAVYSEVCKPKGEDGRINPKNAVYSEVCKPKGPSKGGKESKSRIADNSRHPQTAIQDRKNPIGADGTVYADLSGVTFQAVNKGGVPKPPILSPVEIYASIDHNGRAPPAPPAF